MGGDQVQSDILERWREFSPILWHATLPQQRQYAERRCQFVSEMLAAVRAPEFLRSGLCNVTLANTGFRPLPVSRRVILDRILENAVRLAPVVPAGGDLEHA